MFGEVFFYPREREAHEVEDFKSDDESKRIRESFTKSNSGKRNKDKAVVPERIKNINDTIKRGGNIKGNKNIKKNTKITENKRIEIDKE